MIGRMSRGFLIGALLAFPALLGCSRQDMFDQPRDKPLARSSFFPDGRAARTPPEGTVARGEGNAQGTQPGQPDSLAVAPWKIAGSAGVTLEMLQHGRQRFEIYCSPCHGRTGDGDGMAVQRGFPAPPSYFEPRLREVSDGHVYDVISNGWGRMYGYGYRVAPADRWAIVAYLRTLQLSRAVDTSELTPRERERLAAGD
jgi:mono/diheme cytochrome c family protein